MATLYIEIPAQIYTALNIPQRLDERLGIGKVVTGKRAAGSHAPTGLAGQQEGTSRGGLGIRTGIDRGQVRQR